MDAEDVSTDLLLSEAAPRAPAEASGLPSPPSFQEVFEREAPYVGRTLRYLGVVEPHVEDACQEVFVVVHRQLERFGGGSLRAWVRQICVHVAQNHRRARRRRREDAVAEAPEVAVDAVQHREAEQRQLCRRLIDVLDTLPEEQRAAFVLFEIEQLSMNETALALGCPLQTAYSRLHAARAKVQAAMKGAGS
jgi:RNA polymerase sigma-70 factor (ECF subfamily)